ncbi:smoothened [Elysia marginata]|uniref:Smoothened n=1 Tax=Elysia marginata TaxID=1093978 RepID=A0AAV4EKI6_9GAST|nr:smoothened [Elysia marginata]
MNLIPDEPITEDVVVEDSVDGVEIAEDDDSSTQPSSLWQIFGRKLPCSEVVFVSQMLLIYIIVVVSLFNLSQGRGPDHLWIALLSSSIGYSLPNPVLEPRRK